MLRDDKRIMLKRTSGLKGTLSAGTRMDNVALIILSLWTVKKGIRLDGDERTEVICDNKKRKWKGKARTWKDVELCGATSDEVARGNARPDGNMKGGNMGKEPALDGRREAAAGEKGEEVEKNDDGGKHRTK